MAVFVFLAISATFVKAQESDLGSWYIYFGSYSLTPKWGIWAESQFRNYDYGSDLEQFFVRTAATYNLNGSAQVALGYGYFRSGVYVASSDSKDYFSENRIYQQLITRQRFGRLYLMHRYRLEERFLRSDFKWRFRYFLGANLCLNKPELVPGTAYLSAYNEIFISPASPVFDRNRVYGAAGCVIGKSLRAEVGLMYQLFEARRRPQLQFVFFHSLNFQKE